MLLLVTLAAAATLRVSPSGPYTSIQAAIDASSAGDRVDVSAGTYTGAITLPAHSLSITGEGSSTTFLDGAGAASAITISETGAARISIEGFSVLNRAGGRGLSVIGAAATFSDLRFSGLGSAATDGGAAYLDDADASFDACVFESNAGAEGGAVFASLSELDIEDTTFATNSATYGGAVAASASVLTIAGSTFTGNVSAGSGGAVYASGSEIASDTTTWTGNVATSGNGGAILAYYGGSLTLGADHFEGNEADPSLQGYYGGAFYASALDSVSLDGTTFQANHASYGGAAACRDGRQMRSTGATFLDNDATEGGATWSRACTTLSDSGSIFAGNTATNGGGAVMAVHSNFTARGSTFENGVSTSGNGGAIYASNDASLKTEACTFDGNYANQGGHIYIGTGLDYSDTGSTFDDGVAYGVGGAIYTYSDTDTELDGSIFTSNTSSYSYGGAIYASYTGSLVGTDVVFDDNLAYYYGGAVSSYAMDRGVRFTNTTFTKNAATYGGGGAIYHYSGNPTVLQSVTFDGNEAYSHGGAASFYSTDDVSISSATFTGNVSGYSGGAIAYTAASNGTSDFALTDATVTANSAVYQGGGISVLSGATVALDGVHIERNTAGSSSFGGGLFVGGGGEVSVHDVQFLGNTAGYGGGAYVEKGTGRHDWTNDIFAGNQATIGGGVCFVDVHGITFSNHTFVGNIATTDAAALCTYDADPKVDNAIFAQSSGAAAVTAWSAAGPDPRIAYSAFFDNPAGDYDDKAGGLLGGEGLLFDDPLLVGFSNDGVFGNDSFALAPSSPCRDAGDPDLEDPDGSRSDMGAFGGPDYEPEDLDEDGYDTSSDCDDADPGIYPGAEDEPYDDVDSDCAGNSDWDADGDGHDAMAVGGDDCQDDDPDTLECADPGGSAGGAGATPPGAGPCGCASGGDPGGANAGLGAGVGGALLAAASIGARSRRR